jgi:hypothetical protein
MLWPGIIYLATATHQRMTGLRELRSSGTWNWKAKSSQSLRVIPTLQFHIGKDHAVAAEATFEAKLLGYGFGGECQIIQCPSI